MKKIIYLLSMVFCLSLLLFVGCSGKEERAIRKEVKEQLDQIKESDTKTIEDHIHAQGLLPSQGQDVALSQDVAEIFSMFYQDFSYKLKEIEVKENSAVVTAVFKTIDAKALAKDFSKESLKARIKYSIPFSQHAFCLEDSYQILKKLMESKEYKTVSLDVNIKLENKDDTWKILSTSEFDSALTGNFSEYLLKSDLLSPTEIVKIHFDAIHEFSPEQLTFYLGLNNLPNTEPAYQQALADAFASQISKHFHYKILEETIDGQNATVKAAVTCMDFNSIQESYKKKVSKWLKTSDALSAGAAGRREKEQEFLISSIEKNKKTTSQEADIHLSNDGINWKIQMDSEISNALFGDIKNIMYTVSTELQ